MIKAWHSETYLRLSVGGRTTSGREAGHLQGETWKGLIIGVHFCVGLCISFIYRVWSYNISSDVYHIRWKSGIIGKSKASTRSSFFTFDGSLMKSEPVTSRRVRGLVWRHSSYRNCTATTANRVQEATRLRKLRNTTATGELH